MSDRPSYTIHPQPCRVSGSGCLDFCIVKLNCQAPLDEVEVPLTFEGIEPTDYLTHQPDTTMELNCGCVHNLFRHRPHSKDRYI